MSSLANLTPFDKIEIVRKCEGLSSTQKLILLVIATHLGKNDFAFLSLTTLQKECCLKKRTALSHNLHALIEADIVWRLPPSDGFKSNRYGINLQKLVTNGHQCSDLRLPDRSPTVTRLVTNGHPKRNINKTKEIKKEPLSFFEQKAKGQKAIKEIRKKCGFVSRL